MAECDTLDILWSVLIDAIERIGASAVDLVLARLAVTPAGKPLRSGLCELVGKLGAGHAGARDAVVAMIDENTTIAASALARLGDASVLPMLLGKLEAIELDTSGKPFANQDIIELDAAVRDLGGALTPAARAKLNVVAAQREQLRQSFLFSMARAKKQEGRRSGKVGRNDPCPCGSGRKYKKCCGG
jgi:hypothetical protein